MFRSLMVALVVLATATSGPAEIVSQGQLARSFAVVEVDDPPGAGDA